VCPRCGCDLGPKPLDHARPDHLLQNLVYQLVPSLVEKEEAMRKEFRETFGRDPLETTRVAFIPPLKKRTNSQVLPSPATANRLPSFGLPPPPSGLEPPRTPTVDDQLPEKRVTRHNLMPNQEDQITFKLQMDEKYAPPSPFLSLFSAHSFFASLKDPANGG